MDIAGATGATYTTTQADVGSVAAGDRQLHRRPGHAGERGQRRHGSGSQRQRHPERPACHRRHSRPRTRRSPPIPPASADADGLGALSYQWLSNGAVIGGATATTYTLGDADVGSNISLRVSYTDGGGTLETVTSASVGPVANVNDAPTGA